VPGEVWWDGRLISNVACHIGPSKGGRCDTVGLQVLKISCRPRWTLGFSICIACLRKHFWNSTQKGRPRANPVPHNKVTRGATPHSYRQMPGVRYIFMRTRSIRHLGCINEHLSVLDVSRSQGNDLLAQPPILLACSVDLVYTISGVGGYKPQHTFEFQNSLC